ncbi:hypothetical protein WAE56_10220 [Iodobacter sp. LRB]|uniref:hypothetical protein n=1 Tax=unclassified Iodobacter TaxID=235634 RepID=UPI000C0F1CA1|nr:hypothetical protein [Iodobacter sp. BJB302]PHV01379.1 hypothetical protein CSQ88_12610 [Iodobacter sp. BJB302]
MKLWNALRAVFTREPAAPACDPALLTALADSANPRIKLASRYLARLQNAYAIAHSWSGRIVMQLPAPVELSSHSWNQEAHTHAAFGTAESVQETISHSEEVRNWFAQNPLADHAYAVLIMQSQLQQRYGMEVCGDNIRQDVAQQVLVCRGQQISQVAGSMTDLQEKLISRLLRLLASHAAWHIEAREQFKRQLETELNEVRMSWRYCKPTEPRYAALTQEVEKLSAEFNACRSALEPDALLALLETSLTDASSHLKLEIQSLKLDKMGVQSQAEDAAEITLCHVLAERGQWLDRCILPVKILRSDVIQPKDFSQRLDEVLF